MAPSGDSGTVRRPLRIDAVPVSPLAQRIACALASVGTRRVASSSSRRRPRGSCPRLRPAPRRRPATRAGRGTRRPSAPRRSRARTPPRGFRPRNRAPAFASASARGKHHGVAEGAGKSGLGSRRRGRRRRRRRTRRRSAPSCVARLPRGPRRSPPGRVRCRPAACPRPGWPAMRASRRALHSRSASRVPRAGRGRTGRRGVDDLVQRAADRG